MASAQTGLQAKQENSMPLVRINDTTIAVKRIAKVILNVQQLAVKIYLENSEENFIFTEKSPAQATSLFIAIAELLQSTQNIVPFLFFETQAVRFDLFNYAYVDGSEITISAGSLPNEVFNFESEIIAKDKFNSLMVRLGISQPSPEAEVLASDITPSKKENVKTNRRKKTPNPNSS
jgi:hypothetical protein